MKRALLLVCATMLYCLAVAGMDLREHAPGPVSRILCGVVVLGIAILGHEVQRASYK